MTERVETPVEWARRTSLEQRGEQRGQPVISGRIAHSTVPEGRPPKPWRISGGAAIDMLNDQGASIRETADAARVDDRTLVRVLRRCGFVIARTVRDEQFAEWLPGTKVHHVEELAELRRVLRGKGRPLDPESFAAMTGLVTSTMASTSRDGRAVWEELDAVDEAEREGRVYTDDRDRLPGEHGSLWAVTADAERGKSTTPRFVNPARPRGGRVQQRTPIDEHRDAIVREYVEIGESLRQLCGKYRCSKTTLIRRLTQWGVELRERGRPDASSHRPNTGTELRFPDEGES